jgi:hypothetical protein
LPCGAFVAVLPSLIAAPRGGLVVRGAAAEVVLEGPAVEEAAVERPVVEGPAVGCAVEEPAVEAGKVARPTGDSAWVLDVGAVAPAAASLVVVAVSTVWLTVEAVSSVEVESVLCAELAVCVIVASVVLVVVVAAAAVVVAAVSAAEPAVSAAEPAVSAAEPAVAVVAVAVSLALFAALAAVRTASGALVAPRPSAWPTNVSAPTQQRSRTPARRA